MLARRFAMAIGLMGALAASQLPEFSQQYRQRLGGAVDELKTMVAEFDAEAAKLSLGRDEGIARLLANADPLARARGADLRTAVDREARLARQQDALAQAGPVARYWVLFEDLDPRVAEQAYASYQPAVPVTSAGFLSGAAGLAAGWALTHAVAWPFRRRRTSGHGRQWQA